MPVHSREALVGWADPDEVAAMRAEIERLTRERDEAREEIERLGKEHDAAFNEGVRVGEACAAKERDALRADNALMRKALETIAGSAADKLQATQAAGALANIGASLNEQLTAEEKP